MRKILLVTIEKCWFRSEPNGHDFSPTGSGALSVAELISILHLLVTIANDVRFLDGESKFCWLSSSFVPTT